MPKTRQQRRAAARGPQRKRSRGSRLFTVSIVVLLLAGGVGAYLLRANPPPTRGASAGEHWHAAYEIHICGKRMTNFPRGVEGELHEHGDGFIHIHPQTQLSAGENANLGNFLARYDTFLSEDPDGSRSIVLADGERYADGDECDDDGGSHELTITDNGEPYLGDPASLIPHDGDVIVIAFGPLSEGEIFPNPFALLNGLPDAGINPGGPSAEGGEEFPAFPIPTGHGSTADPAAPEPASPEPAEEPDEPE